MADETPPTPGPTQDEQLLHFAEVQRRTLEAMQALEARVSALERWVEVAEERILSLRGQLAAARASPA